MTDQVVWQPEWVVAPGEVLAEEIENRGLSQSELARRMDRPVKTINEIVHGKAAITAETALQLELTLGISSAMWLGLETAYRRQLARTRALEELETYLEWAKGFPLADLRGHGLLQSPARTGGDLVAEVLSYFGVSSVKAWLGQWGETAVAYRHSPSFTSDPQALAAWLRWGERRALDIACADFDRAKLAVLLGRIRHLTREEPFEDVLDEITDELAACGVALVITPEVAGTHVSGAARWLSPNKALVQLSMRHKSNDHFWFSLVHEIAHLLDRRRSDHVDGEGLPVDEGAEERADRRARDALIPPKEYEAFVAVGSFTAADVRRFAKDVGVAPGIVAGRLQRDRHVLPHKLNEIKHKLRWADRA